MTLYLSRIRLSRSPSAQALAPLLTPKSTGLRRSAAHNLLWSAFSDGPDRQRDFLWREDESGAFIVLSVRPPIVSDLFEPHQVKPFAPTLRPGDRLAFRLRANATRMKRGGQRVDVVMDALHGLPREERAAHRMELASSAGRDWMSRQGERSGFRLLEATAEDYSAEALSAHRGPRKGQPQFGILDLAGQLEVSEPAAFVAALGAGFGRAKAFGCGLMLIRRAP
ncbi:type I-E CRISPR-associated protein Cas6/Cse3/CasE [Salipiger sp. 1_MG-2023]|uniref:type I-E CRISPR-associated protein Cas6/Cse3/CasE n=1 Tax=Salipiger sp. 1_MG-2023 TaxID=3062665 RepID=UPI0026E28B88|nr:type I-E CRISPR-associated protein Cas6/Cse3/CasE [Salipiger sp. 1_MG-2023]MDO6587479.1 type I-E CRISPR-associated protein Cas6/Cse3/CasE [Salipiger sp. 1_MG-2023]